MLVVAGGAELMRPDIAAFADKAKAAGELHHFSTAEVISAFNLHCPTVFGGVACLYPTGHAGGGLWG
jgi:hypothetical protein